MFLENLFPQLPTTYDMIIYLVALAGVVLLVYGVFLETEKRQDLVFLISAACLFVYALIINNLIFMLAMGGLFVASLLEFIEILMGVHQHKKYELKKIVRDGKEKINKF